MINFKFKCPMQWDELCQNELGAHCAKCNKQVYDLNDCSPEQIRELQKLKGNICGMLSIISAGSLIALTSCSNEQKKTNSKDSSLNQNPPEKLMIMGEICPLPPRESPKPSNHK